MDVLVFGANGQVGKEVCDRLEKKNINFLGLGHNDLDVIKKEDVLSIIRKYEPKNIINLSAYTAVDKAEEEKDLCFKVNKDGATNIALGAKEVKAHFIHISTDYVFSGDGETLLKEDDKTGPKNVYGASKLDGENEIIKILEDKATILRTSSVHGKYGKNFVKTMIRLFHEKEELSVVSNQIMCTTWAGFLADIILECIEKNIYGVYHVANKGQISWYDFALKIKDFLIKSGDDVSKVKINPCLAKDYKTPATRPLFSAFCLDKIEKSLGHEMMSGEEGLKNHLKDLGYNL